MDPDIDQIPSESSSSCTRIVIGKPPFYRRRVVPLAVLLIALGACSTSPQGRMQITAPAPISDVYSDANLRIQLATSPAAKPTCIGVECQQHSHHFDQQFQQLGNRLASSAFDLYPDLHKRVRQFEFVMAEKEEPGSSSNASGKIVIFRGVQKLDLTEPALAFLIAREMGHVIGQHHDENSAARILLSVAAGVIFPALNLFANSATVAQATSVTSTSTLATTAASTATSYIGSSVVLESIKPNQLNEADSIALNLLEQQGWSWNDIASAFESGVHLNGGNAWAKDFRTSIDQLVALVKHSEIADLNLNSKPTDLQPVPDNAQIADATNSNGEPGGTETSADTEADQRHGEAVKLAGLADEMKSMISGTATDATPEHPHVEPMRSDGKNGRESSPRSNSAMADTAHTLDAPASVAASKDNAAADQAGANAPNDIERSPNAAAAVPVSAIMHTVASSEAVKPIAEKRKARIPGKALATKAQKLNSANRSKAAKVLQASIKSSRKPSLSASTNKKPAKAPTGKKTVVAKNNTPPKGLMPGKNSAQKKREPFPRRNNQPFASASNTREFQLETR